MVGRLTSFGKHSGKIIYKTIEKLLTNTEQGCIIKVEIKERRKPRSVKMTKQEQIEEMAVIGCVRNPQAHTAEECAKCDFKQGQCNAYRHAEALYNAGYRKIKENNETLEEQIKHLNTIVERLDELLVKGIDEYIKGIDGVEGLKDMWERSAVREFAEKLKKVIHEKDYIQGYAEIGLIEEIDELLKEYE